MLNEYCKHFCKTKNMMVSFSNSNKRNFNAIFFFLKNNNVPSITNKKKLISLLVITIINFYRLL